MPHYEIAWHAAARGRAREVRFVLQASLLQRTLVGRRPAYKTAANLAWIAENETTNPAARERFWSSCRERLGRMTRLDDRALDSIESQLALKVPKPEMIPTARPSPLPSAHPVRGPHQPLCGRAR